MTVDCASQELLAGPRLAQQQHGALSRRDRLDLLQHTSERRALADDFLEVVLAQNLLLEIHLFVSKAILQCRDFVERLRVFDRDSDLGADLNKQVEIGLREPGLQVRRHHQHTQRAMRRQQRDDTCRFDAGAEDRLRER